MAVLSEPVAEWNVEASWGTAAEMHERPIPDKPGRLVWLHQVADAALVLGSAQKEEQLDLAAATADGVEVCRRRSGGGAVLIQPEDCWIDVVIPTDDPLWSDDVGRAFDWLGALWGRVLGDLDVSPVSVHKGPPLRRELGRVVCFAGMGQGEVSSLDKKIVGLSQRRTRSAARFQCLVPFGPDLAPIQRYVAPIARVDGEAIDVSAIPVGAQRSSRSLIDGFLRHISTY